MNVTFDPRNFCVHVEKDGVSSCLNMALWGEVDPEKCSWRVTKVKVEQCQIKLTITCTMHYGTYIIASKLVVEVGRVPLPSSMLKILSIS